jgi:tRNA threonylcarbamoyl adenosine modification protein YeaZ
MRIMLAIETSQRQGSVAVRDGGGEIHSEPLLAAKRHDDDLLPAIDRLMERVGLSPRDLECVGVSVGPGGFTGLRIAVSTAMMFAEALGVKIVAVPSALVAAEATARGGARSMLIALGCKGETFWATYVMRESADASWRIDSARPPGLVSSADFAFDHVQAVVADEHLPPRARERCEAAAIKIIEPAFTAEACLVVAERIFDGTGAADPLRLEPIYPREPEAVSLWHKKG